MTEFVKAADGVRIAYEIVGRGRARRAGAWLRSEPRPELEGAGLVSRR